MSMPATWREFCGFRIGPSVFKGGQPDSENSKLVKAPTGPKVKAEIADTPLGLMGIGN